MPELIQAKCPHCHNVLRIPAEWLQQAMRCKHCQQVFQARPKNGAAPGQPRPAARPASAPPARRGLSGWVLGGALAVGFLAVAGVLGLIVGPEIARQFKSDPLDKDKVAEQESKGKTDPVITPPPDGGKKDPDSGKKELEPPKKGPEQDKGKETPPPAGKKGPDQGKDKKLPKGKKGADDKGKKLPLPKDKKAPDGKKGMEPPPVEKKEPDNPKKGDEPKKPPDEEKKKAGPPESVIVIRDDVEGILSELNRIPPTQSGRKGAANAKVTFASLPSFTAKDLADFKPDMDTTTDFTKMADKYPLRAAVQNAVRTLQENANKFTVRDRLAAGVNPKVKEVVKKEQEALGKVELFLKDALDEMDAAGAKRKEETSKRWLAHYDYTLARLLARLVYIKEYNFALAQIRSDRLPEDEGGKASGYTLDPRDKVGVNESEAKAWVKRLKAQWNKIGEDYPNTPWSVLAAREQTLALGLEWRAAGKE